MLVLCHGLSILLISQRYELVAVQRADENYLFLIASPEYVKPEMDISLHEESFPWPDSDDEGNIPSDHSGPIAGLKGLNIAGEKMLFEEMDSTDVQDSPKLLPHKMLTNSNASTQLLLSEGLLPAKDSALLLSDSVTSEHSNLQFLSSSKQPKWMSHRKEIQHISDTSLL